MKISIIIPVYNVAPYIEECIQSVMNQTYKNLEVLIVDDCGTDNSMDLVFRMLGNQEVVVRQNILFRVIHHDRNKGLSEARNTGIEEASGDYVFFLDSDDSIADNCIETMVDYALKTQADIVESKVHTYYLEERTPICGFWDNSEKIKQIFYDRQVHPEAWGRLVKKELIDKNKFRFPAKIVMEDLPWGLQLFCNAQSLCLIPDKLYYYTARPDSIMSKKNFNKRFDDFAKVLSLCLAIADKYNESKSGFFINWLEYNKAVFFRNIVDFGTPNQLKWYYKNVIRKIHPVPQLNKDNIHYLFPSFIGFYVYQRFYGRRFC